MSFVKSFSKLNYVNRDTKRVTKKDDLSARL